MIVQLVRKRRSGFIAVATAMMRIQDLAKRLCYLLTRDLLVSPL